MVEAKGKKKRTGDTYLLYRERKKRAKYILRGTLQGGFNRPFREGKEAGKI